MVLRLNIEFIPGVFFLNFTRNNRDFSDGIFPLKTLMSPHQIQVFVGLWSELVGFGQVFQLHGLLFMVSMGHVAAWE